MRKILLFILLFSALGMQLAAQAIVNTKLSPWISPSDKVTSPEYPGGKEGFMKYVSTKLAKFHPNKSFDIIVSFVIEKDGTIEEVKMTKGTGLDFDKEVMRIVRRSRRWTPGTVNGEPARIGLSLPIRFNITESEY